MKPDGRYKVDMGQRIHNRIYHFTLCVRAASEDEAMKKAGNTFIGYKAVEVVGAELVKQFNKVNAEKKLRKMVNSNFENQDMEVHLTYN